MKQNVMKRTLAGVLAVLTVAAYMPANVGGFLTESTGIVMGVSAEEAIDYVIDADGTIKLNADATYANITVANGVDATIDLNGHTLTVNGRIFVGTQKKAGATEANGSSLVISGGDVNTTRGVKVAYYGNFRVNADATLTSSATQALWYLGYNTIDIYGKVTTTATSADAAVSGIGNKVTSADDDSYNAVVNVYAGGEVSSQVTKGIYMPNDGTLNVYGGTISGTTGIYAKSGNLNISGGTINATGAKVDYSPNGNGGNATGDALVIEASVSGYAQAPAASIIGGSFNSANAKSVATYKASDSPYELPTGFISGGTFNNILDSSYVAAGHAQDVEYVFDKDSTITLDEKTTCGNITGANGVDATIDLDSNTLTVNGRIFVGTQKKAGATEANGSSLVISGGDVNTTRGVKVAYYGNFRVNADATLTSSATQALWYLGYNTIDIYGKVTTTATSADAAVSGIGNKVTSADDDSYNAVVNVYAGGEVSSQVTKGIYMPNDGTLNVYGGTISGTTGIYAKSGNLNISGGTINATGAKVDYSPNGNGGNATGDALVIEASVSGYAQAPAASIIGGSFNSANAKSVATYKASDSPYELPTGFISGGTFDTDVSAYVAEGYYQDGNVVKADERVDLSKAKIVVNGGKAYSSSNPPSDITSDIKVTIGDDVLDAGEDYEIYEGDTSAYDIGTYVFKIRGLGNYKGTATANWTISSIVNITVFNGETSDYFKSCQYGKSVTVTPPSGITWDKNSYWEVDTGTGTWEIVSYSQNYSFIALKNVNLRVGHKEEEVSEKSVLTMSTSRAKYSGKDAIKFTFNRSIDDKYTVKEVGILYGTNKLVGANTSISDYAYRDFTNNDTGVEYGVPDLAEALKTRSTVKKGVASSKSKNGTYEFSCAVGTNHTGYVNAIGYVKVYDPSTKKDNILYTNVVADCYDSALYSNN